METSYEQQKKKKTSSLMSGNILLLKYKNLCAYDL